MKKRKRGAFVRAVLAGLIGLLCLNGYAQTAEKQPVNAADLPWVSAGGVKNSEWHGFKVYEGKMDAFNVWVAQPKKAVVGKPWIFRIQDFGDGYHWQLNEMLLEAGAYVVAINSYNVYGADYGLHLMDSLYHLARRQFDLPEKCVLTAGSRAGLSAYRWAIRHPERVACIYCEGPVLDFKTWPMSWKPSAGNWAELKRYYGFASDEEAIAYKGNPIDNLEPIAKARIPIRHVISLTEEHDTKIVPNDKNTLKAQQLLRQMGHDMEVVITPEGMKVPYAFDGESVEFMISNAVGFKIPRLSPLPEKIEKQRVSLNGEWLFNPSPEKGFQQKNEVIGWDKIEVPGEWAMQGFEVKKGEAAGYFRTFTVPRSWEGKRIKLRCNGVYSDSRVYINGKEVGSHLGGFTAFELDVTEQLRVGEKNRIALSVRSESLADSTSSASQYAVHPLGGITRDIYLFPLSEVNLAMFHVSTSFDEAYQDAVLKAEVEVSNESSAPVSGLTLRFTLKDAEGKEIPLKQEVEQRMQTMEAGETRNVEFSFDVVEPQKWDSEHPYLYTLICRLEDREKHVLHETKRRVGFRQIEIRGNQMFINNMPVKLRGVCRHEVMPLRGRSLNGDMWRKDVELFRQGNVNYIRTSHYPPDEALLEACDELGMLVEVEAPFCWAHNTNVPENQHYAVLVNQHVEMVHLNRSHPSVIMWSLGNESMKYAEYFKKAGDVVKMLDATRPRIFSQWSPNADNGELEVTNHHYPGPTGPDKYCNSKRPVTFDEYCHLNAYNRFELAADPGLRTMWGRLLDQMWTAMYHSQGVLGGAIWVGIDDTFFLPDGRTVGYGTWGTIDGWRREKPEYWGMKKAYSPVKISQKGNMDEDGTVRFQVENRHNFSNLNECKVEWQAGGKNGCVTADIPPRSEGELKITLPESVQDAETLELTVTGVRGFMVDKYNFRLLPERIEAKQEPPVVTMSCQEKKDCFEVQAGQKRFTISKRNGLLSAEQNGSVWIEQAPALMVLPLNSEGDGIQMTGKDQKFAPYNPLCENWVAHSISCMSDETETRIRVSGTYKEAEGMFEYVFHRDGSCSLSYDFTLLQDVSPRQVGLVFTLPSSFTHLQWSRKGYWSVYPEEHIGALEGEAEAFNVSLPVSGLAGPSAQPANSWALDQTAAGSNNFRSTKENIYSASLGSSDGNKITVASDGTQHVRAWIDGDVIRFLVADYSNPGKEGYLSPHSEKEYRPLKKGDKIQGTIRIL